MREKVVDRERSGAGKETAPNGWKKVRFEDVEKGRRKADKNCC